MIFFKNIPSNLQPTRKETSIKAEVYTITPEQANWILNNLNDQNRDKSCPLVRSIVGSIVNNKWKITGQPIIFDTNGNLLDGQHRLQACEAAQKPIDVLVVTNVDPEVFSLLDTGKTRTVADVFKAAGIPNSRVASAVVSKVFALRQNFAPYTSEGNQNTTRSKNGCRPQLCLEEYHAHEKLYKLVTEWVIQLRNDLLKEDEKRAIQKIGATIADLGSTIFHLHNDLGFDLIQCQNFIRELVDVGVASELMLSLNRYLRRDREEDNPMRPKQYKSCIAKAWELYVSGATKSPFNFKEVKDKELTYHSVVKIQEKIA